MRRGHHWSGPPRHPSTRSAPRRPHAAAHRIFHWGTSRRTTTETKHRPANNVCSPPRGTPRPLAARDLPRLGPHAAQSPATFKEIAQRGDFSSGRPRLQPTVREKGCTCFRKCTPHTPVAALTAQARQDRRRRTSASPEIAVRIRPTTRSETFSHRVEGEPARAAGTVGRGQSPKTTAHRREGSRSLAPLGAAAGATPLFSRPRDIARRVGSARSPSRRPEIAPTPLQTPSPRRRAGKIWRLEPPSTPWAKSGPRRPIFEGARRAARRLRRAARQDRGQAAT